MKKILYALILISVMLSSCVKGSETPVLPETTAATREITTATTPRTVTTPETTSATIAANMTTTKLEITTVPTETTVETTEKPESLTFVDEVFECIKTKDVEQLKYQMGYHEGEDGWLYNVEFESFEVVEEKIYNDYLCVSLVKITVSESTDARFPVGESFRYLEYDKDMYRLDSFTAIDDKGDYRKCLHEVYDITASDRALMLAYSFEHAFGLFDNIPDISKIGDYLKTTDHFSRCTIQHLPIIMGLDENTELTQEYVNTWYNRFFGITEQPYDFLEIYRTDIYELYPTLSVLELSWKSWDNVGLVWRLDEQTESTITITFFGDRCYLTPAITMKYTYEINDGIPRLLSSEVVEDFGYEPLYIDFY